MPKSRLNPAKVHQQRPRPRPQATRCRRGAALFPAQLPRAGAATHSAGARAGAPPLGRSQPMRPCGWPARATGPFLLAPPRGAARTGRRAGGRGLAARPLGGGRLSSLFLEVAHAARTLCPGTWRMWKVKGRSVTMALAVFPPGGQLCSLGDPGSGAGVAARALHWLRLPRGSGRRVASCQPCLLALAPRLRARTREALARSWRYEARASR